MHIVRAFFPALLISLVLALAGCSDSERSTLEFQNETENSSASLALRIINGTEVSREASPQFVEVLLTYPDGSTGLCSGTIIGGQAVLSAGHCFRNGESKIEIRTVKGVLPVLALHIPEAYRVEESVNAIFADAAILMTPPHGLPGLGFLVSPAVESAAVGSVYGFGLDENGEFGTLKSGETFIEIATPNHFIATEFSGVGTNSCNGDSGGPLLQFLPAEENRPARVGIVGLVSSGTAADCVSNDRTLFTNLQNPSLLGFILKFAPGAVLY